MKITKAVMTAARPDQNRLPLQRFVDLDGQEKSALQIILEEVAAAGVEKVCVVVRHGDEATYREAAGDRAGMLGFVQQPQPRGYGDALYRAASFVAEEPFVHVVSDHLYISGESRRCAEQLVETARREECPVSAVQATRENMLPYYGTVGGQSLGGDPPLYVVDNVLEKPSPTEAEQKLLVPGLRAGHYLCLFGMHVLTPTVMEILGKHVEAQREGPVMLSPALAELAARERYLAVQLNGSRYNIGMKYGMLLTQLALALAGTDREEILTRLVELLAGGGPPKIA